VLVGGNVTQTDEASPLLIASQNGHDEAVRALLDAHAAVNQTMVCVWPQYHARSATACSSTFVFLIGTVEIGYIPDSIVGVKG
jgi:ankyrin repeat protein